MSRSTHPHKQGTPERILYDRWRRASTDAKRLEDQAAAIAIEAGALRAKADHYAKALDALGHPVTPRLLEGPKA